ncbi:nascent polypeptide-associated complex subunit alpha, muscle-specific form-like [Uranotaenia lowii]|uniref:nascent polypeptide-associated complex subunit alpha, muscle-specific form-like n=1 Tax=Uranotaenia lowii TaxID=190385 RepID=UPI002479B5A6|nr:nascent polypeptide-associated complex subunit alpha, muscle-specific form-like [Uranotaenia lowii]
MSFFTSVQEMLVDIDQSSNLNGYHFSNSLFGFDSNSIPCLENVVQPSPVSGSLAPAQLQHQPSQMIMLKTPSPIPATITPPPMIPLVDFPKTCHLPAAAHQPPIMSTSPLLHQLTPPTSSPLPDPILNNNNNIPAISKFSLKVTPNNEIYISNEAGTFCELAGSFVPSKKEPTMISVPVPPPLPPEPSPAVIVPQTSPPQPPTEPPKTLYCIEKGIKRPLSPTNRRYCNSGIFRSELCSPSKKKPTSTSSSTGPGSTGTGASGETTEAAKLVVSNVINNGLIVNKKYLSTTGETESKPISGSNRNPTPDRKVVKLKKRKKKKVTLKAEPTEVPKTANPVATKPSPSAEPLPTKKITSDNQRNGLTARISNTANSTCLAKTQAPESALNFSGIKERAAQKAIFERPPSAVVQQTVVAAPKPPVALPVSMPATTPSTTNFVPTTTTVVMVENPIVEAAKVAASPARVEQPVNVLPEIRQADAGVDNPVDMNANLGSPVPPVELKVVADLVMDKDIYGHISLVNNSMDKSKSVIYQNPVTTTNVVYNILGPKSLNLGLNNGPEKAPDVIVAPKPNAPAPSASPVTPPAATTKKPTKKRGRKPKTEITTAPEPEPNPEPNVPVLVTRSGRLSKPPRYVNSYYQSLEDKEDEDEVKPLGPPAPVPPPSIPVILPRLDLPTPDPETAEKLPNFSAALTQKLEDAIVKRKVNVPLQYRCATCNKIYLGKRMQRHLEKYPTHNSARDCMKGERVQERKSQEPEEKSTYLYKHLFDLLQRFAEKEKGRVMLKEISHFVDYVRALIPRLITNDEQNSTVEYIDHNVADVLRLNHGKYRFKLSSWAEESEKLNVNSVGLKSGTENQTAPIITQAPTTPKRTVSPPTTSRTPGGAPEMQQSFSFNADDILHQSSSFPSLSTLVHEHNLLQQQHQPHSNNNNNPTHSNFNNPVNNHQSQHLAQPQYIPPSTNTSNNHHNSLLFNGNNSSNNPNTAGYHHPHQHQQTASSHHNHNHSLQPVSPATVVANGGVSVAVATEEVTIVTHQAPLHSPYQQHNGLSGLCKTPVQPLNYHNGYHPHHHPHSSPSAGMALNY